MPTDDSDTVNAEVLRDLLAREAQVTNLRCNGDNPKQEAHDFVTLAGEEFLGCPKCWALTHAALLAERNELRELASKHAKLMGEE